MNNFIIGTAGHIDHGKSALVQALTGINPDRLKEEQERGITIDLGFSHYEDRGKFFSFIDVPGHERFVKNMLAGVSGIDCVLLVIAADEAVMPQTREHFDICCLLRVGIGMVALTKVDLVDSDTVRLAKLEIGEMLAGSFLENAPVIPVSVKTGEGLRELRSRLREISNRSVKRVAGGPVRLPIDRVFSVKGFGTVVTGTLVSGCIDFEQELVILPAAYRVKVRGVQIHGSKKSKAEAGQRVAVNLSNIEIGDLHRGDTLVTAEQFKSTYRFDAAIELLPNAKSLRHGARIRFHHGTTELLGRLSISSLIQPEMNLLDEEINQTDSTNNIKLQPGSRAYVRVRLEKSTVLTRGDRFVLRAYSPPITIGGGYVLDPQPPRVGVRSRNGRLRFRRLNCRDSDVKFLDEAICTMLEDQAETGLEISSLTSRAGVIPEAVEELVKRLVCNGQAILEGNILISKASVLVLTERLLEEIGAYHHKHPLEEGLPREEARERVFKRASQEMFERVIADLVKTNKIVARKFLALATHELLLSEKELHVQNFVKNLFLTAKLRPPDRTDILGKTDFQPVVVNQILELLVRQNVLVRVGALLFHRDALQQLKQDVVGLKAEHGDQVTIDVSVFKNRHGITRKFAIPLLEYLDKERITRRVGSKRIVI